MKSGKTVYGILLAAAVVLTLNALAENRLLAASGPFFLAAGLLAGNILLGFFLLSRQRTESRDLPVCLGVGLGATVAYFFAAGFLKLLTPAAIWLYLLCLFGALLFTLKKKSRREHIQALALDFWRRPAVEYLPFLLPFIYAALPATFYDSLVYHLGIPNLYLQQGGFVATPQFMYANTSIYYEISLIPALYLGEQVPRFFHFLLGAFFLLALVDFARQRLELLDRRVALLILISVPMSLFLLTCEKSDLVAALFIFLAWRSAIGKHWLLSSTFWGGAVGIKYSALLAWAVFLLLHLFGRQRLPLKKLVLMTLLPAAIVVPLLLKNFLYTGNPFFPFLSGVFPSPLWDASRYQIMIRDVGHILRSVTDVARAPYDLSFREFGAGGRIGPILLVLLPFFALRRLPQPRLFAFSLITLLGGAFFSGSLRFSYFAVALLCLYAAVVYEQTAGPLLRTLLVALVAVNILQGVAMLEHIHDATGFYSSGESKASYLSRRIPAYPVFQYANERLPEKSRILLVGEARNFYLHRPYSLASALDYGILKTVLAGNPGRDEFFARLKRDGYSHVIFNMDEFARLQSLYHNLDAAEAIQAVAYFRGLTPLALRNRVALFAIP